MAIRAEAGARFEQALATLFFRSGWTQEKLAEKEGKSQHWISLIGFASVAFWDLRQVS